MLWCPVAVSPHIPHRCSTPMWGKVSVISIFISIGEQRNFPATLWYDTLMSHWPRKSSHSEASDCWDQSRTGDQITGRDGRKPELCQHRMREVGAGNALTLYLIKLGPLLLLTENLVCLCEDLLKKNFLWLVTPRVECIHSKGGGISYAQVDLPFNMTSTQPCLLSDHSGSKK